MFFFVRVRFILNIIGLLVNMKLVFVVFVMVIVVFVYGWVDNIIISG